MLSMIVEKYGKKIVCDQQKPDGNLCHSWLKMKKPVLWFGKDMKKKITVEKLLGFCPFSISAMNMGVKNLSLNIAQPKGAYAGSK